MYLDDSTTAGYCPNCDSEVDVIETVPWQEDLCTNCNLPIPDDD